MDTRIPSSINDQHRTMGIRLDVVGLSLVVAVAFSSLTTSLLDIKFMNIPMILLVSVFVILKFHRKTKKMQDGFIKERFYRYGMIPYESRVLQNSNNKIFRK